MSAPTTSFFANHYKDPNEVYNLGNWIADSKSADGNYFVFRRDATVDVQPATPVILMNSTTGKRDRMHGPIKINEIKRIDRISGAMSIERTFEPTDKTVTVPMIN